MHKEINAGLVTLSSSYYLEWFQQYAESMIDLMMILMSLVIVFLMPTFIYVFFFHLSQVQKHFTLFQVFYISIQMLFFYVKRENANIGGWKHI